MAATFNDQVAAEIRGQLGHQNVKQTELAARLGCAASTINQKLNGIVPLRIMDVELIADALGVPVHTLIPEPAPLAEAS